MATVENVTEQEFREIFGITSDNLEASDEHSITTSPIQEYSMYNIWFC